MIVAGVVAYNNRGWLRREEHSGLAVDSKDGCGSGAATRRDRSLTGGFRLGQACPTMPIPPALIRTKGEDSCRCQHLAEGASWLLLWRSCRLPLLPSLSKSSTAARQSA